MSPEAPLGQSKYTTLIADTPMARMPSKHLAPEAAPRSEHYEAADEGPAEAYAAYAAGGAEEANEVVRSSSAAPQRILAMRRLIWLA
jgi:hypothetical protein